MADVLDVVSSVWGNAGMTRTNMLPNTGHENNIAQPRTDKWLSPPAHFDRFSPLYCCLSVVL